MNFPRRTAALGRSATASGACGSCGAFRRSGRRRAILHPRRIRRGPGALPDCVPSRRLRTSSTPSPAMAISRLETGLDMRGAGPKLTYCQLTVSNQTPLRDRLGRGVFASGGRGGLRTGSTPRRDRCSPTTGRAFTPATSAPTCNGVHPSQPVDSHLRFPLTCLSLTHSGAPACRAARRIK